MQEFLDEKDIQDEYFIRRELRKQRRLEKKRRREKQLLIIAMLWALAICSKKEFPVIVDTPLARLDSAHRESLIQNYFPKASKQMVLLSTDSEVYGRYYDLIKPYVDHEITLAYDEEKRKSYVIAGYFGG